MTASYYRDQSVTIYNADCLDVIGTIEGTYHIITDPPYSESTHEKHNVKSRRLQRQSLDYASIFDDRSKTRLLRHCPGWALFFCDSWLLKVWKRIADDLGRVTFAPVPCIFPGMTVRFGGDGPANWATYLAVSRPKGLTGSGSLPGAYVGAIPAREKIKGLVGIKPEWLMRTIISDYTKPGDLVVDCFGGSGTTARAAVDIGRRCIIIEKERRLCDVMIERLAQRSLFVTEGG